MIAELTRLFERRTVLRQGNILQKPPIDGKEWRRLIDTIPIDPVRDLRDRALNPRAPAG